MKKILLFFFITSLGLPQIGHAAVDDRGYCARHKGLLAFCVGALFLFTPGGIAADSRPEGRETHAFEAVAEGGGTIMHQINLSPEQLAALRERVKADLPKDKGKNQYFFSGHATGGARLSLIQSFSGPFDTVDGAEHDAKAMKEAARATREAAAAARSAKDSDSSWFFGWPFGRKRAFFFSGGNVRVSGTASGSGAQYCDGEGNCHDL